MTANDPTAAAPATPGQDDMRRERAILRWAADRLMADEPVYRTGQNERAAIAGQLRRWADEMDAAPGVYQLPAEPDVAELWDVRGLRWTRTPDDHPPYLWWCDDESKGPRYWRDLLLRGPLSTAPPAGTEGE